MDKPLISVIIPSYNSAKTIGEAISSILLQTYPNLEIVVVDDDSTDNTREVVEGFTRTDARVKYFLLPEKDPKRINWRGVNVNAGYSARNFGMEKACGEWITFQDADDASLLNRIEVQYELAKKYDAIHVCTDWQQLTNSVIGKRLDAGKILLEEKKVFISTDEILSIAEQSKGVLMQNWFPHNIVPFIFKWFPLTRKLFFRSEDSYPGAGNNPLFRREVMKLVRFRNVDQRVWPSTRGRGADRDFNFQVAETFKKSIAFHIPLYLWRVRSQNPRYESYSKYIR